ncbi:MAG: HD domain-containing protein [Polyangiaceae bacterium]|nr:HD domain-containing protein [Polyangiaceae bacterium]
MADSIRPVAADTQPNPDHDCKLIQKRLALALQRSSIGENKLLTQEVRERGEQLVGILHSLFRTMRMYEVENQAFDKPIAEFLECLRLLIDSLGPVSVVTVEDQVYVNDVRIRVSERTAAQGSLGQELRKHNVGGVTFHSVLSTEEARCLFSCFAKPPAGSSPRSALTRALYKKGVRRIEFVGLHRYPKAGDYRRTKSNADYELFDRMKRTVEQTWDNAVSGMVINARGLRRVVAELIEVGPGSDALWDRFEDASPHVSHTLRVGHLSLVLGSAIGLAHPTLQDLGVAALLHDFGYAAPSELAARVSHLRHLLGHTVLGARMFASHRGFHEGKVQRILVALHHHHDYVNRSGSIPPLFGRIVRIAEDYDNFTRPDAGAMAPPEALAAIAAGAGSRYDPILAQLLVNLLGRFPPGTILELDDGRTVCTLSMVRDVETFATPRAFVVGDPGGWVPDYPGVIDLAEGGVPISVLRSFTPRERVYR